MNKNIYEALTLVALAGVFVGGVLIGVRITNKLLAREAEREEQADMND